MIPHGSDSVPVAVFALVVQIGIAVMWIRTAIWARREARKLEERARRLDPPRSDRGSDWVRDAH